MNEPGPAEAASRRVWAALAILIFGIGLATAFHGYWASDLAVSVPIPSAELKGRGDAERHVGQITLNDYRMGVWAFSRNAYTLVRHPAQIFQAEPCYPVDDALALHHPVITQGLLALPGYLLTGDPVATTNLLLFLTILLGAFAVCLLVADWTALPAAGVVAGMLYAFHPAQIGSPFHLGTKDYTWTVLALFFARRLFERGRFRDALGLAVCGVLQMATSFYPLLGSATIALPVLVWLVWHYGVKRAGLLRLATVVAIVLSAALFLFSPYAELQDAGILERRVLFFAAWSRFAPGGDLFPGWTCLLLVAAAFGLGRKRALAGVGSDPRLALSIAAVLLALLATGGNVEARMAALKGAELPSFTLPNLFSSLRSVLPGLDAVRMPVMLAFGARMLLCILAGLGAAALLRVVPRGAFPWAAALLILLASVETLRPAFLGLDPPVVFESLEIRPSGEAIDFFRELEAAGNEGPLLEVPIAGRATAYGFEHAPLQHMLSAWHHRRTSGCSASSTPPRVRQLEAISSRLALPGGLDRVRELGFTTIVVHHPAGRIAGERYAAKVAKLARRSRGRLVRIAHNESMTAYGLVVAGPGAAPTTAP